MTCEQALESCKANINTSDEKHKDPMSENAEQQPEFAKNKFRSLKPEILVLEGVCTHLGCVPLKDTIPPSESVSFIFIHLKQLVKSHRML